MNGSTLRLSFGSIQSSGWYLPSSFLPFGMTQAIWAARSSTGNSLMRMAPLLPASRLDQLSSTPQPSGVTMPRPVTTTRLIKKRAPAPAPQNRSAGYCRRARSGGILLEETDGIGGGQNGLRRIRGNLDAELLLEGHDEFDRVEAVGTEVIDKAGVLGNLLGIDAEMLNHDLLNPFC